MSMGLRGFSAYLEEIGLWVHYLSCTRHLPNSKVCISCLFKGRSKTNLTIVDESLD